MKLEDGIEIVGSSPQSPETWEALSKNEVSRFGRQVFRRGAMKYNEQLLREMAPSVKRPKRRELAKRITKLGILAGTAYDDIGFISWKELRSASK